MAVRWIMAACLLHIVVAFPLPDPGRLLRVPRIYNALITSDAKLQPSRAFAYSAPVFQPYGLGPVPGFDFQDEWQAPSFVPEPMEVKPEEPSESSETPQITTSTPIPPPSTPKKTEGDKESPQQNKKAELPVTFYPRSFGFYQTHQPIIPYTYQVAHNPYVYTSPFGFGHTFYKYPVVPFGAGFHGTYIGYDHILNSNNPELLGGEKQVTKNDSKAPKGGEELKSDSVGVREAEFLSDFDDSTENSESADLKKADAAEKS